MPVRKGPDCVGDEMRRYKKGQMHSGEDGPVVKDRKQAVAVALSACGQSKYAEVLRGLGYSESASVTVTEIFSEINWDKQFDTGKGPGPQKEENYKTGTVKLKGLVGARIGKSGPGDQGKQKGNDAEMLSGPALEKGPGNPQGGSSKEVQGMRQLG